MLQKVLSMDVLSTAGSTFARFAYAAPAAFVLTAVYLWFLQEDIPHLPTAFWGFAWIGALAQILATVCVVALFRERNFAVGITFKKTEVIQAAILGVALFGDAVSLAGWGAILIGLVGVLLLSRTPGLQTGFWQGLTSRATLLGVASGFLFAISGTTYRAASLEIASDDPILRAATDLTNFVFRGSIDEKIHFIFNMYDTSHDNTVSKEELTTLLNHGMIGAMYL